MASIGSDIVPRDAQAGTNSNLTAGAIAGIACGAGALFLGAAGLFAVYWRRQRQFDREDNSDQESFDERAPPRNMAPVVTYTLDYKMDDPQHHEGDGEGEGSSYTYSPEKPSYAFSPLGAPDTASAMPTHPAYIPRALVRGSSTPSNRSAATTPFPSPPFSSSKSNSKTQPEDMQAYLAMAAAAPGQTSNRTTQDTSKFSHQSDSSSSGLPSQPRPQQQQQQQQHQTRQPPAQFPTADTAATSGSRKPRSYIPPRLNLNPDPTQVPTIPTMPTIPAMPAPAPPQTLPRRLGGDKPLQGKETTTISGPLAFPQHCHHPGPFPGGPPPPVPPGSGGSRTHDHDDDEHDDYYYHYDRDQSHSHSYSQSQSQSDGRGRSFRSRALSGEDRERDREREREKEKGKKHARKKSDRNSGGGGGFSLGGGGGGGGNRHYAEIEIGRGSDIW